MICKRCERLLRRFEEEELGLCYECQALLKSRPKLIEVHDLPYATNNEPVFFVDDLSLDAGDFVDKAVPHPSQPSVQRFTSRRHAPLLPASLKDAARLVFFSFLFLTVHTLAVHQLQPHLIGFNSLDAIAVVAIASVWWLMLKEVKRWF